MPPSRKKRKSAAGPVKKAEPKPNADAELSDEPQVPDLDLEALEAAFPAAKPDDDAELEDVVEELQTSPAAGLELEPLAEPPSDIWRPGVNCGRYVGRRVAPLGIQAQVLVVNLVSVLAAFPKTLLRAILREVAPVGFASFKTLCAQAASSLLRVAVATVVWCHARVKAHGNQPQLPQESGRQRRNGDAGAPCPESREERERGTFTVLVRTILGNASEGRPYRAFIRCLARLDLAGVAIGDRWHSRAFVADVEFLGARTVEGLDAADLAQPLAGSGIVSDVSVSVDGVSLGSRHFARHESLLVVRVVAVCPRTCKLMTRLIGAPSQGIDHSGEQLAGVALGALERHPAQLTVPALERRLCCVSGDGASVEGGEAAHHHQTLRMAEHIFARVHGENALQARGGARACP